jgi:hypothetical protein
MSNLDLVPLRNNILLDFKNNEVKNQIISRINSLGLDVQKYKLDNEFLNLVCNLAEHLINKKGDSGFVMDTAEQREFGTNMYELFKDIDVNGDGDLEWQVTL